MELKQAIFYILYISPVFGLEVCMLPRTEKFCSKSGLYNIVKEKCEHEKQSILSNNAGSFINRIYNDKCNRQLLIFSDALRNSTLWAFQMLDASTKTIEGYYQFGHFDECIDTDLGKDVDNIYGKYCLLHLRYRKEVTKIGVCVPNECGEQEMRHILRLYYQRIPEDAEIIGTMCTTNDRPSTKLSATIFRFAVLGLLLWIAAITVVDLLNSKLETFWEKVAEIFSCYRSIRKLTEVKDELVFPFAHILKVGTISLIILCRRYQILKESPVRNPTYFKQQDILSLDQFSDLLIFQSGFLAAQKLSEDGDIWSRRRCFRLCAIRLLRLIPLYVALIAFYATILEDTGNGPLWVEKTGKEAAHCRDFWWANLSFINNYISSSRQCIAQSWYIAVTAHCSLLILILMHLNMRKSYVGLGSFALLFSIVMFLFVKNDFSLAKNHFNQHEYIRDSYIKTHNRVQWYAIGAFSAFLYNYVKKSKDAHPRPNILLMSFVFGIFSSISIITIYISHTSNGKSELMYSMAKNLSWSSFTACAFITSSIYNIGIFKTLQNIFVPLSRLSYSALLLHGFIQLYTSATMRVPEYITTPRLISMGSSDIFASYASAFFLHLIIEGPTKSWINTKFGNK